MGLLISIVFASAALVANASEKFDVSILLTVVALCALYVIQQRHDRQRWLANPLRLALPIFTTIQALFWFRCLVATGDILVLEYRFQWVGYLPQTATPACAQYLLMHFPYFLAMHFGFQTARSRPQEVMRSFAGKMALAVSAPVLILNSVGFVGTYGKAYVPALIGYAVTTAGRLTYLCWMLVTVVMLTAGDTAHRQLARLLYAVIFAVDLVAVSLTGMRYLLIDQLVAALMTWFSMRRISPRSVIVGAVCGGVGLVLWTIATDLKTSHTVQELSPARTADSLDGIVARAASFHADAVAISSDRMQAYFVEQRGLIIVDILGGIPFSGVIGNRVTGGSSSFDMGFHQVLVGAPIESSFLVPVLTALRYGFGAAPALLAAVLAGWLLGYVSAYLYQPGVSMGWLIQQSVMLPISVYGLAKADLFRPVVNMILCHWMFRIVTTARSIPNVLPSRRLPDRGVFGGPRRTPLGRAVL
jgi:hypothetical protein